MVEDASEGSGPRWRRRKADRPAEITAAAFEIFAERGFAAAKLDDIAKRAGVAKGSLYVYFATKEELFRAVVRSAVVPNLEPVRAAAQAFDGPLADLVPYLLASAAGVMSRPAVMGLARMVIAESRNFPDIAAIWHDEVAAPMIDTLSGVIARAQVTGEVVAGDARLQAFSLVGPMVMAMLFRDVFVAASTALPDLGLLAAQHAQTALNGLLAKRSVNGAKL